MKKFLVIIFICSLQNLFSQTEKNKHLITEDDHVYNNLRIVPNFPGGFNVLYEFVRANFRCPDENPNIKGKIFVNFVVEKDGTLTNFKIYRDLGYNTAEEIIRVLQLAPKWIPGRQNDEPLRFSYTAVFNINN
ncbi:energy transducer TonB [Flavobacterium sp. 3-218]